MSHFPTDDELRAVFDDYSMGDGSLDREEFKRMCYKYYIAPTYKDVDEVFKELDKNSDEKLTFDEVKNYIAANWKPILDSQNQFLEDLQSCRKKDGPITRDELREILQQPGEEALTDEEIDEIFQLIDLNDDNEISVDEISKLLFNIEAVSRAVSRCESRRSRGRKKSRSRSRSSSKGRKHSKSRDRKRSKSRSKSRDRKRSKSRSKSRDRKRSRSNERKRSGSRGRKRSSSRGSRHSGSAGSRRGGSGHGRGYEISQGVVSGEAETVSEVIVQNAEAPEQSNQEQTEEQKPETNEQSNVNNEQSNQEQVEAQNPETTEQSNVNNEQSNQEAESGNNKKDDTTEQNDAQQTEENKPEKTEDTSEQKAE